MKAHGVDQPIVVDEQGVILKGHGRRLAAIEAKFEGFPVVVQRGLSEQEKIAMRISDNQVMLLGGWDPELIRHEMIELRSSGYDLQLLGFGEAQLVQFTTQPGPPTQFPGVGEDIETSYRCPKCDFVWSGNPKPGEAKSDDNMRMRVRRKPEAKGRQGKAAKVSRKPSLARPSSSGKGAP